MTFEKKQEKNKLIYNVTVPADEFKAYYNDALSEFAKEMEIDGFRKGHAPIEVVKSKIDPAHVLSHAVEDCIQAKWFEILNQENIEAIKEPSVDVLKMAEGNPLEFKAEVEILPEVKLPDYKKIGKSVSIKEIKVEEKDIKEALKWLVESRAKFFQKEGKAEKGDLIEITYTFKDVEGDKDKKDRFVLGKGHYLEGLEDALIGLGREEKKEVQVVDPKEKKKFVLNITVDSVQKMEVPELNDEFAKTVGFDSVKDLEENTKQGLNQEREISEKQRRRTEVLEKIVKETKVEVPETLIEREGKALLQNLKDRVSYELQMPFEQYLKEVKKTEEEVSKEFNKVAVERVKGFLVLHEIEKMEKVTVTEEEIDKKIDELAANYPDKEKVKEDMKKGNAKFYVEDELKKEKIFNLLGC
ncbi:MAG: trigger factor [Candidatus Pacebacteria bacterium]|nr:trigger factor [Candidatus Paceibacterota bacterium]